MEILCYIHSDTKKAIIKKQKIQVYALLFATLMLAHKGKSTFVCSEYLNNNHADKYKNTQTSRPSPLTTYTE